MTSEKARRLHEIRIKSALDNYTKNPEKTILLHIACEALTHAELSGYAMPDLRTRYEMLIASLED